MTTKRYRNWDGSVAAVGSRSAQEGLGRFDQCLCSGQGRERRSVAINGQLMGILKGVTWG
jgi:hypothetical protein